MDFVLPLVVVAGLSGNPQFENTLHVVNHTDNSPAYVDLVDYYEDEYPSYEELKFQAIYNCRNARPEKVDEELIDTLIEIEKNFSPPPSLRGMILAAACHESGYNPKAKGDRKFSKNKKTPRAIGILQQWRWYERAYGTVRTEPTSAANTWMQHITRQIPKVKKRCKYKTQKRIWIAAWVTGVRSPKPGGRCYEKPKHYRLLKRWHKNVMRDRENSEGDGC